MAVGWGCPSHEVVNPLPFERGAQAGIPTLWLHGNADQYYRIEHCRRNFDRFRSAGGQGTFIAAPMGHALLFKPALWSGHVDQYLQDSVASAVGTKALKIMRFAHTKGCINAPPLCLAAKRE